MHQFEPIPWPIGGGIPPADFLLLTERLHNEGPPPVPGMTEHRRFPFNRQPRERCGDKQTAPCTVGYRNGECIAVHMVRLGGEWVEFQPGEKVELAVDWELRRFVVSQRYSIEKDPLARNSAFPCREMEVVSAVPFSAVVAARVSLHNIVLIFGAQPQSVMRVRTNNPWFPKGALRSTFPLAEVWFEAHCEESPAARAGWDRLLRLLPEFPPLPNGISPTTKIDQIKELVAASPVPGLLEAAAARAMTSSSRRTEHEYLRLCALARQDSAGWIPETQEEKEYWLGIRPPPPSTHAEPLLGLPWTASFGCVALAHRWKGRLPLDAMVYVWAFAYPQESLQLFEHFGNPALRCRGDRRLGLELKYLCTSTCVSLSANFFRLHESEETRYHTSFLLALEATGPDARERLTRGLARSELANSEGFMSFIARQLFRDRLWVRPSVLLLCLLRACHRWAPSIPTAPAHRAPPYPPYRDYDNDDGDGDRNTATAHADNLRPRRAATQSKKTGNAATVVELHRAAVQRLATQQPHPADWAKVADAPPPAKRQRQLVPW